MKAKALRLYGKEDLRLDEYELPEIKDDEILARVVSDSIWHVLLQGSRRARIISVFRKISKSIRLSSAMSSAVTW